MPERSADHEHWQHASPQECQEIRVLTTHLVQLGREGIDADEEQLDLPQFCCLLRQHLRDLALDLRLQE